MRQLVCIALSLGLGAGSCAVGLAQGKACSVITKAEAEAVVGTVLEPPQATPKGTTCRYLQAGYGEDPAKNKMVTIALFQTAEPHDTDVNLRRQAIADDRSLLPVVTREIPNFGDAALWVWAGGYFGALYAFKGGTTEVGVKISGISEAAALTAAKKFAARALGGTEKSGFSYAPPDPLISNATYNAPGILAPLYLGTFSKIPDDEMTRDYVISLAQAFNFLCPRVPETLALMNYGAYYEWHANNNTLKQTAANNLDKAFASVIETMQRAKPHILEEGRVDAVLFLKAHEKGRECLTTPVEHLYNKIAELALERQNLPPDVDNDVEFLKLTGPAMQKKYANGVDDPDHPSQVVQLQLQKVKRGCLAFTKGAVESMEVFCRCQVDAAKEAKISGSDLDLLGDNFTQATLTQLGTKHPEYQRRKQACYR